MAYEFLIDTYATERLKVISVWSMFRDDGSTASGPIRSTLADGACTSRWCISASARMCGFGRCSASTCRPRPY